MSSKQNDQAEALRQAIEDVTEHQPEESEQTEEDKHETTEHTKIEVDILNLPPRNEVHKDNRKMRIKLNLPLLRFLFIVVLLLILAGVIIWFI
ncbi:hypothetical protein [Oceanobacillus timonensis]|uniref:hypothetical protein n=1 Tax=Oceanobacillus timonensis TaxID=1926285 RepID=UPI0009B95508|nr:hypothetical protein [Oceanobacillus timonensis]